MRIVSLVPRLFPAIDGVGDYALHLAKQLLKDWSIETSFVIGDPTWQGEPFVEGFATSRVEARNVEDLVNLMPGSADPQSIVLVHYVGHGYAKRGCAHWLIQGLEQWKKERPNAVLITMFHELYAIGVPWKYDFWLSQTQRNLASRLAVLSDICFTNGERYSKALRTLSRGKHSQVPALPVFSNIGELQTILPLVERQPRLILFGQTHSKRLIYQSSLPVLKQVCQTLSIEEIWDIGPSVQAGISQVGQVPIREIGQLPATEISQILANSYAGFLNYDPKRLAKSGIFAAYCAHGLIPINHHFGNTHLDGLVEGVHYLSANRRLDRVLSLDAQQVIASNAHHWYLQHNLSAQAALVANHILTSAIQPIGLSTAASAQSSL